MVLAVDSVLITLATLIVILRVAAREMSKAGLMLDDYCIIGALVS